MERIFRRAECAFFAYVRENYTARAGSGFTARQDFGAAHDASAVSAHDCAMQNCASLIGCDMV
jgi:hypothetical protein